SIPQMPASDNAQQRHVYHSNVPCNQPAGVDPNMGHFSMEKSLNPGSVLGGHQHSGSAKGSASRRCPWHLCRPESLFQNLESPVLQTALHGVMGGEHTSDCANVVCSAAHGHALPIGAERKAEGGYSWQSIEPVPPEGWRRQVVKDCRKACRGRPRQAASSDDGSSSQAK